MSGNDEPPEDSEFAEAIGPVKRIRRGGRVPPKSTTGRHPRRVGPDSAPVPFVYPVPGEPRLAYSQGIDQRHFDRLRSGRIRVDAEVDLHGLSESEARTELRESLERAQDGGARCVRVVHGRGLHSAAAPVLKNALPEWLTEAALQNRVLAFAPATPDRVGATLVLLRRQRRT